MKILTNNLLPNEKIMLKYKDMKNNIINKIFNKKLNEKEDIFYKNLVKNKFKPKIKIVPQI